MKKKKTALVKAGDVKGTAEESGSGPATSTGPSRLAMTGNLKKGFRRSSGCTGKDSRLFPYRAREKEWALLRQKRGAPCKNTETKQDRGLLNPRIGRK